MIIIILAFFVIGALRRKKGKPQSEQEQLVKLRQAVLIGSIALLIPIFVRYLLDAFNHSLVATAVCVVLAFALIGWGILARKGTIIMYSNILGGALALFYLYTQLWSLGDFARIVVAALGLIVAVGISIFKLKDKLK